MKKSLTPDKAALNIEIGEISTTYLSSEKIISKQRSKAFQNLCYSVLCGLDYDELNEESIVDGDDEQGFDIFDIREIENALEVVLINCKSSTSENYSGTEMLKIKNGLNDIFSARLDKISKLNNKKLLNRIAYLRDNKQKVINLRIYYCVFSGAVISKHVQRYMQEILDNLKEYTEIQYPKCRYTFELLSSTDIYKELKRNRQSLVNEEIKIPYFDPEKKHKPEITTSEGLRGYVATISGNEIAKLVVKYGDQLFEKNIRGWLKYNQKKREIFESCTSSNSHFFWFLNNGITIVGDRIIPEDDKSIWIIKNLQIVNGQQTARMLSEAYTLDKLNSDVKVLCRLYETNSNDFINKITKATNSQSAISGRDLMSNDIYQIGIQDLFKQLEIFYERQKGEEANFIAAKKISSKNLAQASLAIICKKPSLARKNIEDNFFNESKFYKEIFNNDPKILLVAYSILEYAIGMKNIKNSIRYFGALHLSSIIFNQHKSDFEKQADKIINNFKNDSLNFKTYYDEAVLCLHKKLPEDVIKEDTIGSYLSRIEFDTKLAPILN